MGMKIFKLLFFTVLSLLNTHIFSQEQCGTDEIYGIYLQETLFLDGTREVKKIFMGE